MQLLWNGWVSHRFVCVSTLLREWKLFDPTSIKNEEMVEWKREQHFFLGPASRNFKTIFFSAAIHLEVIKFNEFHLFIVDGTASRMCCTASILFSPPICWNLKHLVGRLLNYSTIPTIRRLVGSHSGCCIKHFPIDAIRILNHLSILLSKLPMHMNIEHERQCSE